MNFASNRQRRFKATLDATPLIDVVFLLLIFVLLTTTFSDPKEEAPEESIIDLQLAPTTTVKDVVPPESVDIYLDESGQVYIDSAVPQVLEDWIRVLQEKSMSSNLQVNLRADKRVSHGEVIEVLDAIKAIGIEEVNLVLEKRNKVE